MDRCNDGRVVLIDASGLGTKVKEGKNQKTLLSEDEENRIIEVFNARQAVADFSVVVNYEEIAAKNYSLSAGQYFEVKIDYVEMSPAEFEAKLAGFTDNLDRLFEESKGLEIEIRNQLRGVKYEKS